MAKKDQWGYGLFETWKWRDYDGKVSMDPAEYVTKNRDRMFLIGTDSQNYTKRQECVFTSMLISYNVGHGGSCIIHRDKVPFMRNLRQRLLMEAMRSLEVAWFVDPLIDPDNLLIIHLDVNRNLRYRSAQYKDELVGLIVAQGFKAMIKPDAWAASKGADSRC